MSSILLSINQCSNYRVAWVAPAPLGYGHGPCECDEHEALLSQRGRAMLLSVVSFNSTIRPAQSSVTVFFPCGGLSWLPVSFLLHVKYTLSYRIVSYRYFGFRFTGRVQWTCFLLFGVFIDARRSLTCTVTVIIIIIIIIMFIIYLLKINIIVYINIVSKQDKKAHSALTYVYNSTYKTLYSVVTWQDINVAGSVS